jgi:hypothetical protein
MIKQLHLVVQVEAIQMLVQWIAMLIRISALLATRIAPTRLLLPIMSFVHRPLIVKMSRQNATLIMVPIVPKPLIAKTIQQCALLLTTTAHC